jgi:hypothetical protein
MVRINYIGEWNSAEPYFWTVGEITGLDGRGEGDRDIILGDWAFHWSKCDESHHNRMDWEFRDGWINILVIHKTGVWEGDYERFINRLAELPQTTRVIIVFAKGTEDYWLSNRNREGDEDMKKLSSLGNVTVIWDAPFAQYPNFHFSPKVHLQSYWDNETFNGDIFFYGESLFRSHPKSHRIGLHINKVTDRVRNGLANYFFDKGDTNLFFTTNRRTPNNKTLAVLNWSSPHFDSQLTLRNNGHRRNWYLLQFIEQTVWSEMEVVYETFTLTSHHLHLIKWNEKTIKLLYLGKPFIHTDPFAHRLMYSNGIRPYRTLYTDELWEIYESWDITKPIDYTDNSFVEPLIRNIEWLRDMSNSEWSERIEVANGIAKGNREYCNGLIFNTHLRDFINE